MIASLSIAPPTITNSSTVVFASEGETVSLSCEARGKPHPQIHWCYGSYRITGPTLNYSPQRNGTLVIYEVSAALGGAYSCEAENAAGKEQATMLLVISNKT